MSYTRTIPTLLSSAATRFGSRVAVVAPHVEMSWAELSERVRRSAAQFARLGLGHGDRVVVQSGDQLTSMLSWLALSELGAIAVPVNPAYQAEQLATIVDDCEPRAILGTPSNAETIAQFSVPAWSVEFDGGLAQLSARTISTAGTPRAPLSTDAAAIVYTTGSTGRAKGCVLTHGAYAQSGEGYRDELRVTPDDRYLLHHPLFHVAGQCTVLVPALASGARLVIPGAFSVSRFWDEVQRWEPSIWMTGFAFVEMLARGADDAPSDHTLRRVVSSTQRSTFEHSERFGFELGTYYAQTENAGRGTIARTVDHFEHGYVGHLFGGDDKLRITRDGQPLGVGEVGEIEFSVPTLMAEYFHNPEATAETLVDGWLRTGDLGEVDDRGHLYFRGRLKNIIRRSGENISTEEVEFAVAQHPAVEAVVALPVADRVREEEVKVVVVLRAEHAGVPAREILDACGETLPAFKRPRYIEFVQEIPHTVSGKPDIATVRARHANVDTSWDANVD